MRAHKYCSLPAGISQSTSTTLCRPSPASERNGIGTSRPVTPWAETDSTIGAGSLADVASAADGGKLVTFEEPGLTADLAGMLAEPAAPVGPSGVTASFWQPAALHKLSASPSQRALDALDKGENNHEIVRMSPSWALRPLVP